MAGKRTGLRQPQPERTNRNTQKGVDNMRFASALLASAALLAAAPVHAKPADPEAAKKILKDSVAIPTVEGRGKVPELAAYYAGVLKAEGYADADIRSEENTSELQSLMRTSYAVFCLKNTIEKQRQLLT